MAKRINFEVKEKIIALSGACFWYWSSFYSFLTSCDVPKDIQNRFPKGSYNKYQVMRNVLDILEESGQEDIINKIISNFYKLNNATDRDKLDNIRAKRMLSEFRDLVGSDPVEKELQKREAEQSRKKYLSDISKNVTNNENLESLNKTFIKLTTSNELTPQKRGFELENLLYDLLQLSEFVHSKSYRTKASEQIDGHFKFESFDYLIECKWEDQPIKQKDLSIFDGKIRGKAQSTRGFFIAANGFDINAIQKFSGDSPRIILMTGEDLALVLNGNVLFYDAIKAKVDAIVRYGNIHFPLREIT